MIDLEEEGIEIWRAYRFFIPGAVKKFFVKIAIHCEWQKLKKELEG